MAIVAVSLGSSPTGAGGDTNREAFTKLNTSISDLDAATVAASPYELVSGGDGYAIVGATVTLDLTSSRVFLHEFTTGTNITSLSFTNVPSNLTHSAVWTWVIKGQAAGGITLSGTPTVTWLDGNTWSDLNLDGNHTNIVTFWQVSSVTYAALVTNGDLRQDAYRLSFATNGAQLVVIERAETLELGSVTNVEADGTAGTGTLSYKKDGVAASGSTAFAAGDVLEVTLVSSTTPTAVLIPRAL